MNKWTNGHMDDVVKTDHPFVHLSMCPCVPKTVHWLGGQKESANKKIIHAEKLGTKNGQMDEKWTDGKMALGSRDRLIDDADIKRFLVNDTHERLICCQTQFWQYLKESFSSHRPPASRPLPPP